MAYTVLARKYRSQTFDDVLGQDPIAATLKNSIEKDKVAHAYLFTGTRGVGKTTVARILAKSLNCLEADGPTTKPCCKCDSCTAINSGDDIDVIEIDGASHTGVDDVREIRQNAIYRPARARFKVYIIDEVHMLSNAAFNALLKILEEPPDHVKFIFATTEPNKVLPTIQSRCQRFDFSNISVQTIAEQIRAILKKEKIKFEDDLPLPIAKMANGSMRDALSLLDRLISTGVEPLSAELIEQFLGCPSAEKVFSLLQAMGDSDPAATLDAADSLITAGLNENQIASALTDAMRDLMVAQSAGADSPLLALTADQQKRVAELADKFDTPALVYNITALEKLQWTIKNSDTPRPLLEASLLRFALAEHFLDTETLLARAGGAAPTPHKKKVDSTRPNKPAASPGPTPPRASSPKTEAPANANRFDSPAAASRPDASTPTVTAPDNGNEIPNMNYEIQDWPQTLESVAEQLGPATCALLAKCTPRTSQNGRLTLQFPPAAEIQMKMCQSNGRAEQIQTALSDYLSEPIQLAFELAQTAEDPEDQTPQPPRPNSRQRNEILNHPAIKSVLMKLDATVTDIETQ